MNWEAIGAAAELLGAMAVLATLVYLALQVRHSRDLLEENKKIALSQVYAERSSQRLQDIRLAIDSPNFISILAQDRQQNEHHVRRRMVHQLLEIQVDTILYHHKLGLLDASTLASAEEQIRSSWELWNDAGCFIHPNVREWHSKHMSNSE